MLTEEQQLLYSRNIALPEIGVLGQEKLREASVLVIGAGGLGCPALLYLSAAGVGKVGIVDADSVELSNLQRQVLYGRSDVGKSKSEIAAQKLQSLYPDVHFNSIVERLSPGVALELFPEYDLIIDGTDNFPTKYLISDVCTVTDKVFIGASLSKFEGQLSVYNAEISSGKRSPSYRDLFPSAPHNVPNCAEAGVIGAFVGTIGSIQAMEAIKILAGFGEPLVGKLLIVNALDWSIRRVDYSAHPVAGKSIQVLPAMSDYEDFCGGTCAMSDVKEITPIALKKMLDAGEDFTLVDVREESELQICKIGGLHIPLGQITERAVEIPMDKPVVFYCKMGGRSFDAATYFAAELGHPDVTNLKGGILLWRTQVDPSMSGY